MHLKTATVFCLALLLAACSKNPFLVTVSNCPAVAVLGNTGSLTRFEGSGRNAEDVAFNATIAGVSVDCDEDNDIYAEISFAVLASGGPALSQNSVSVPYFVALLRDNNLITAKKIYETRLDFGASGRGAAVRERVVVRFDDVDVPRRYDYELLIGFQLTPDEVIYNVLR